MSDMYRGSQDGSGQRVAVIQARFNESVTEPLLRGALEALTEVGVERRDVRVCSVPGAVEIPLVAQRLARSGDFDAVVALGAVIRGETSHYDYVCRMAADGCQRVSLDTGIPVAFGVLTCDDDQQSLARCAPGEANKGREAALAAVELANLLRGNQE